MLVVPVIRSPGKRLANVLPGTYRADLLARGEIRERVITLDELRAASRIWLINSVHGSREAVLG